MYNISLVMGYKNKCMIEWRKLFRYSFIESKHPTGPTKVIAGLLENPCSYEAVEKVYRIMICIYKLTRFITKNEEICRG